MRMGVGEALWLKGVFDFWFEIFIKLLPCFSFTYLLKSHSGLTDRVNYTRYRKCNKIYIVPVMRLGFCSTLMSKQVFLTIAAMV